MSLNVSLANVASKHSLSKLSEHKFSTVSVDNFSHELPIAPNPLTYKPPRKCKFLSVFKSIIIKMPPRYYRDGTFFCYNLGYLFFPALNSLDKSYAAVI